MDTVAMVDYKVGTTRQEKRKREKDKGKTAGAANSNKIIIN